MYPEDGVKWWVELVLYIITVHLQNFSLSVQ